MNRKASCWPSFCGHLVRTAQLRFQPFKNSWADVHEVLYWAASPNCTIHVNCSAASRLFTSQTSCIWPRMACLVKAQYSSLHWVPWRRDLFYGFRTQLCLMTTSARVNHQCNYMQCNITQYYNTLEPSGHYTYRSVWHSAIPRSATQCVYVFCVDLRTNSDYFPIQH